MSFKRIALLGLFLFVVNITLYSQKDNTENYNIHSLKQSNFIVPTFDKEKYTRKDSSIYFEENHIDPQTACINNNNGYRCAAYLMENGYKMNY
jgi:hypothetical protein